jgi:hypothetical protein
MLQLNTLSEIKGTKSVRRRRGKKWSREEQHPERII